MSQPLHWYFDFISPFAYLQWPRVRALMATHALIPVPVVLAAVLNARGQKGPAEIPGKREFTYRHALWQARQAGLAMRFPPAHPFNPIAALRLCTAAGASSKSVSAIFDWIWTRGEAGDSVAALTPVALQLGLDPAVMEDPAIKQALRDQTDAALGAGVFGVPTLAIGDTLFWGNDSHDFAVATLTYPSLREDAEMQRVSALPQSATRRG